nr:solute carrier family 7 member 13 isoform X2 [Microcebus murinus]
MDKEKKIQLRRVFGYYWGTNFLITNLIGAGIFVAPKGVLQYCSMNVGLSLCVWAGCAVLSMMTALCYAEIDASRLIEAVFQGYFAYSGGGCFTLIAGELKTPRKTIPRIIFTALPLVTILYLLLNISLLTVLTPKEIISSDAVAIAWTDRVFPSLAWVIPFAISASLFSNLLINVFESARVIYIASQHGHLPLLFHTLNSYSSPFVSVLLLVSMGSLAIVLTNLIDLINYLYFMVSFCSVLSMVGILKRRFQEPDIPSPYKVFLPFPLITMAISLCLVLIPLLKSPSLRYVYVLLFVSSGLLFYIPLIHFKLRLVWFEKMTCYLQLLFNICIPDVCDEQMSEVQTVKKK